MGLATIVAETVLSFSGHPTPTALDYVLCTLAGAIGGGFRAQRNGNGYVNGEVRQSGVAGTSVSSSTGVKAG